MAISRVRAAVQLGKAIKQISESDNPAKTAGKVVSGAVKVAHPVVGAVAGPMIERGVEKGYRKVEEVVTNPENRAKAAEAVHGAAETVGRSAKQLLHGVREAIPRRSQ